MNCTPTPSYCYRHSPELIKSRSTDDLDVIQLQKELSQLPLSEQSAIQQVWDIYHRSSKQTRLLLLKGIIYQSCTPQLSYIANSVKPLLRIDFTSVFPPEITKQIFTHLDASSLCAAAQVNQHWKRLADDDTLWHRMCEQHINKKCTKCGWGLPLLQKRKVVRVKRSFQTMSEDKAPCDIKTESISPAPKRMDRRPWKDVYSERLVIERNWRRNNATIRTFNKHHTGGISSLQFCEAQNILITGSYDKTAIVWHLETGERLRTLQGHTRCIRTLQFDDTKLVTGSMDNTLRIWNYHTGQCIRTLEGHTNGVVHLHFNCRMLASGSADATIKIWNFQTGECFTLTGHTKVVNHVSLQQGSATLVSSSDDGTVRIWDLDQRTCVRVLKGHMAPVQTAIPSMPGFLHAFYRREYIKPKRALTPPASSDEEEETKSKYRERSSEQIVISGSLDNTIKVWSLESGECLQTLFGHMQGIWTLAYDKLRLVSGSHDGSLKLWDIESGLPLHSLDGHTSAVTAVNLSDTKVVSADDEGHIRVWDFGVQA
ncbi:WD40-repeat-containing domain protein [Choanephora cucurbitarum]|nr:WD40-repeat-containing domain protein [Choanephora cucurbitarum]